MNIAALVAWLVTATGGFAMLTIWVTSGGLRADRSHRSRFQPPLILGHGVLAILGLLSWFSFVASDRPAFAWLSVALLVVVAGMGFAMLAKWLGGRASADAPNQPEQRFPSLIVVLHGLGAVTTLVLATVAAMAAS